MSEGLASLKAFVRTPASLETSAAAVLGLAAIDPDWETGLELTAAGGGAGIKNWLMPRTTIQDTKKKTTRLLLSKTILP